MKKIGGYLLFFGIGSIVLNLVGFEFILLMWIDSWGAEIGWGIRIGFIALGAIMMVLGPKEEVESEPAPVPEE